MDEVLLTVRYFFEDCTALYNKATSEIESAAYSSHYISPTSIASRLCCHSCRGAVLLSSLVGVRGGDGVSSLLVRTVRQSEQATSSTVRIIAMIRLASQRIKGV
jgi:hypothetical protein